MKPVKRKEMKRFMNVFLLFALFSGLSVLTAFADNDKNEKCDKEILFSHLPKQAQDLIQEYFPNKAVMKYEEKASPREYEVTFDDGNEITFDVNGQWMEMEAKNSSLPVSVFKALPGSISDYMNKTYPGKMIKEIERNRQGYKVTLQMGRELEIQFDKDGKFMYDTND